ncbi:MAG TPA: hypothetical protein VFU43_26185 [Streptosporangiaceae bacterium]|nr:hypothetical protein [Streptosporangiaceae bacterium]
MMSPGRQERVLANIENRLRRESPDLVARFTVFARLVQDEGPPPPECPEWS